MERATKDARRDVGLQAATDNHLPSRGELEAAIANKKNRITGELSALREEVTHIPVRRFIREHPVPAIAVSALVGFGLSQWIAGKFTSDDRLLEKHQRRLLEELLDVITEDAARAVAAGEESDQAVREAVRAHAPIILETPRREPEKKKEGRSVSSALVHGLLTLLGPFMEDYLEQLKR